LHEIGISLGIDVEDLNDTYASRTSFGTRALFQTSQTSQSSRPFIEKLLILINGANEMVFQMQPTKETH
jgi:hypothetical protein